MKPAHPCRTGGRCTGSGRTAVRARQRSAWPLGSEPRRRTFFPRPPRTCPVPVVVVARTHARGLIAAQELAALAAGPGLHLATAYDLAGLVLVADAPGKLPKPLAELAHLVSGGYPRTWRVPYVDAWRLGEPPSAANTPDAVARIGQDLAKASAAIDLRGRSQ